MATLALSFAPATFAANTWGTDFSDMWWIPTESGWGANISHQGEVVFMTLYVYGADNRMRWYAATNMQSNGGTNAFTFVGDLFEFVGPYYGAALFNPSNVGFRRVGTASVGFSSVGQGSMIYSIDGVFVSKDIERQTFRENNLSGSYVGTLANTVSGCITGNGSRVEHGTATVSQAPDNAIYVTTSRDGGDTCDYAGAYVQSGRMGAITGTLNCSSGASGTFVMAEIEAGYLGFTGRYSKTLEGSCSETGTMAWLVR
jgi:hypothetical protein